MTVGRSAMNGIEVIEHGQMSFCVLRQPPVPDQYGDRVVDFTRSRPRRRDAFSDSRHQLAHSALREDQPADRN
jgi:hypothetical protein